MKRSLVLVLVAACGGDEHGAIDAHTPAGIDAPALDAFVPDAPALLDALPIPIACDPLTQIGGGQAACGSVQADDPDMGCYSGDFVTFSCEPAGPLAKTDRAGAANGMGQIYLNSCAPGFSPFLYEATGSTVVACVGLCAPHDADNTQPLYAIGDATIAVKLPADLVPTVGHGTCEAGIKGSVAGEDCRYLWTALFDASGNAIDSDYANTVGYCIANSKYKYDPEGGTNYTTPFPSCADLPPRSATTTGDADDADDWGCNSAAFAGGHGIPPYGRILAHESGTLRRYQID